MAVTIKTNNNQSVMPVLKYPNRIKSEIPVIKFGYECVTRLIAGLKESSTIVEWSLNVATSSMDQVVKYPLPYVKEQLLAIDQMLCTTLDLTELNLPVLTKTPQKVYEEGVEYVMGIIVPIAEWVDMELTPIAEHYVDQYLPELDPNQKKEHIKGEVGSRTCQLAVTLSRRVRQHAYAEPKYLGKVIYQGFEQSISLMKTLIFEPKLLKKTFQQVWKKLGDGVTPEEAANSLLLVEMGCIKLRQGAAVVIKIIEISEEMAKCYIEMFIRYVNARKNYVVNNLSRVVNHTVQKPKENTNTETLLKYDNTVVNIKNKEEDTSVENLSPSVS